MRRLSKALFVLGTSLAVLSGCGNHVEYKSDEDREYFTASEIKEVENTIKKEDGVAAFEINDMEGGYYAKLVVKDKGDAKDLAVDAFNLMRAETSKVVDLFVTEEGNDDRILIQAYKPRGKDDENQWDIML